MGNDNPLITANLEKNHLTSILETHHNELSANQNHAIGLVQNLYKEPRYEHEAVLNRLTSKKLYSGFVIAGKSVHK